jgi:AraC-like DNA-binding protein
MSTTKIDLGKKVAVYLWSLDLAELSNMNCRKISTKFGLSRTFLSRKFKDSTQMCLFDYLEFVKIIQAAELLNTCSDQPVREISRMGGLKKSSHFRKKFKKIFCLTPHLYRKIRKMAHSGIFSS